MTGVTGWRVWCWNVGATAVAFALALTMWKGWLGLVHLALGFWLPLVPATLAHTWLVARTAPGEPWAHRVRSLAYAVAVVAPWWLLVVWPLNEAAAEGAFGNVAFALAVALIYGAVARPAAAREAAGAAP